METALAAVITQEHTSIAESFLARVMALLDKEGREIKSYAVTSSKWLGDDEVLALQIDEKQTLTISLNRSR